MEGEIGPMSRVYICGPMSGIPAFNFPAFDQAADELRELGYDVITPTKFGERVAAMASVEGSHDDPDLPTWAQCLGRDIQIAVDDDIDSLVCLRGWERSRGAKLETFAANKLCGKPIFEWANHEMRELTRPELESAWLL